MKDENSCPIGSAAKRTRPAAPDAPTVKLGRRTSAAASSVSSVTLPETEATSRRSDWICPDSADPSGASVSVIGFMRRSRYSLTFWRVAASSMRVVLQMIEREKGRGPIARMRPFLYPGIAGSGPSVRIRSAPISAWNGFR